MFDEVQSGIGRTGKFFAYQRTGVTPDVMAVAKGLGGGFPVGACLATAEAGKGMTAGTHGSTFGGNPLAMAVGNAVLDVVLAPGFLERVQQSGAAVQAAPRRDQGSPPDDHRGSARRRPAARLAHRGAERRTGRRLARGEDARGRRRRQCRAAAAAADRHRRGDRRSDQPARPRRQRPRTGAQAHEDAREQPGERAGNPPFPRPDRHSAARAARHARSQPRHEEAAQARARRSQAAARRQDAGDDLRQAVDAHARVVRRRDAPARRRRHHADRPGNAARPRRDHRRHRARAVALCRCHHDPHPRARDAARARRATPPCR